MVIDAFDWLRFIAVWFCLVNIGWLLCLVYLMVVCEFLLFVTFGMFVLFWFDGFLRWLLVCGALCSDTFLWLLL